LKDDTRFIAGMRAIAALMVFWFHAGGCGLRGVSPFGAWLVNMGRCGVPIFFVISGFTIFSQFFTEKYKLKEFLLVRLFRISIPYFPLVVMLGAFFHPAALDFITHFFYLNMWHEPWQNSIVKVEWTLGVEVFSYVIFGLLIHFRAIKLNADSFLKIGGIFLLLTLATRLINSYSGIDGGYLRFTPFRWGYMFYLGGLAYWLRNKGEHKRLCFLSMLALLYTGLVIGGIRYPMKFDVTEYTSVALAFTTIVFYKTGWLNNKTMIFLGTISYSFYLLHFQIMSAIHGSYAIKFLPIPQFILALAFTVLTSFLWYTLFEQWIYKWVKAKIKGAANG
jgi:peptidoglycan/LPS O-acetylase OafA/YrhL